MAEDLTVERARLRQAFNLIWSETTSFVRRRMVVVLVVALASSALAPLGPMALKLTVDTFTNHTPNTGTLGFAVALYVLSQWLSRCLGELRGLVHARIERRLFTRISDRVFEHVMQLPLRFHLVRATGAINQTLENGLQGYQLILHRLVFMGLPVTAQLLTTAWIIYRIEQPVFLGLFCCAVACYGAAFSWFIARASKAAKAASEAHIEASAVMTDSVLNYETVKLFTAEDAVRAKLGKALDEAENHWVRFFKSYTLNGLTVATIFAMFLAAAIMLTTREVAAGRMTVGELVLVNTYMLQLMQPIELLGHTVHGLSQGGAMLGKVLELLGQPREAPASAAAAGKWLQNVSGTKASLPITLEFRGVSASYDPDRPVLRNVSFSVAAGKTLGIVGPSGGGKSTIVRLLARLLEPDEGEIFLNGVPVSSLSKVDVRRMLSVIPQDTVLFNESIAYNIALGRSGCTQDEIEHAARLAHLQAFIEQQPDGYNTRVGERGVKLSGGEKQRVSIARAVLKAPCLYVLDEATSSLDSTSEGEIMNNLYDISRSCTTLIVAHRLSTVVHADEIIVLRDGVIVDRGTHSQLLANKGIYTAMWQAQHRRSVHATGS